MKCQYCNEREATHWPKDRHGVFNLCCVCYVKRGYPINFDHPECLRQKQVMKAVEAEFPPRPKPEERYKPPGPERTRAIRRVLDVYEKHFMTDVGREMTPKQLATVMNALFDLQEREHEFYGIKVG